MSTLPITGHCLCGQITYSVSTAHQGACICHCDACRRSTGSAYSIVITVARASVRISGPYKEFLTETDSGPPAHRIFCPNCGSQIANYPESSPEVAFIKAGTLDDEIQKTLVPDFELFVAKRLPYIQDRAGKQYEGSV